MTDPRDDAVAGAITRPDTPGAGGADPAEPRPSPVTRLRAWFDGLSLQRRLLGMLVIALLAALAATGYSVQLVLRSYMVGQIDNQLLRVAMPASSDRDGRFFDNLVSGRMGGPSEIVVQLFVDGSAAGPVQGGGIRFGEVPPPTFPRMTSAQAGALLGKPYDVVASDGTTWRVTSFASPRPVALNNVDAGLAAVTVGVSLSRVQDAVAQLRLFTLLIGTAVILLCTYLGWLVIQRSFQPLVEVEETAAAIAAGDLSRRIPSRPPSTEVGRLTTSLNGMLTQIESAFRAREASEARTRQFAADASHELRTPLVSIRGFAELYRQGAVPVDEVPRTMRRIEDEAKRMGSLVEDLLLLARLDAQRPARHEPVDLVVLAGDAAHDAHGLDATRRVRMVGLWDGGNGRGPAPTVVTGDEDRLRQVVANLVGNAVRHTPAGTPIEVAVGLAADQHGTACAVLEVRDHGPGLTPEQAERVFQRFYRLDSSRHRGQGGGSGLGLSIVQAVVTSHGGTVEVLSTPGGGATFQVVLPARTEDHEAPAGRPVPVHQPR